MRFEAISSPSVTCYPGEETEPHPTTTSFQVVVETAKVPLEAPFLQAKQPQPSQWLLTGTVLQTLHQKPLFYVKY